MIRLAYLIENGIQRSGRSVYVKDKNAFVDPEADKSLMTDTNGKFNMDVYLKNRDKIIANRNNDGARTNGTIDFKEYRKNRKSIIARGTGE